MSDPDIDGSLFGGATVGDFPPPACWPTSSTELRIVGPSFPGDVAVHVAGGATTGTRRVHIGPFGSPSWYCDLGAATDYLCGTSVGGSAGDLLTYTWANPAPVAVGPAIALSSAPTTAEVRAPLLGQPIDTASRAISVLGLHPGAEVTATFLGGTYRGYALDRTFAVVPIPPGVPAGTSIVLTQEVGAVSASSTVTSVSGARGPYAVRAPWGVEFGAYGVAVAGFAPGSQITVKDASNNAVLGSAVFGESVGVVPICAAPANLLIEALRNGQTVSTTVTARHFEDDTGSTIGATARWGSVAVCRDTSSGVYDPFDPSCFASPPAIPGGVFAESAFYRVMGPWGGYRGLVILTHGNNFGVPHPEADLCNNSSGYLPAGTAPTDFDRLGFDSQDDSFSGWEALQSRLARAGFRVISVDVHGFSVYGGNPHWIAGALERDQPAGDLPVALVGLSTGAAATMRACKLVQDYLPEQELRACVALGDADTTVDAQDQPDAFVPALFIDGEEDGLFAAPSRGYAHAKEWPWDVAQVTIPGGTHAWFNECWLPNYHGDEPDLSRAAQNGVVEDIVQRYLTMVFDAYDGADLYGDLARGHATLFSGVVGPHGLNVYRLGHYWRAGTDALIDDFETAPPGTNAHGLANTVSGAVSGSETVKVEGQERSSGTRWARLAWSGVGSARLALDPTAPAPGLGELLAFDLMVALDDLNDPFLEPQVAVALRDDDGDEAVLPLSTFGGVRPAMGSQQPWELAATPQTFTVPLASFVATNPDLDLGDLVRLAFRFPAGTNGAIYLDQISFRSP